MLYTLIFIVSLFKSFTAPEGIQVSGGIGKDSLFIPVYNYNQLKPYLAKDNDTTYVVNFWATWCVPCVLELPYFEALKSTYKDEAFKLVLVSLDFKKDYIRKLQPFVLERGIESNVVVLEDNDSNCWIEDIDKSWTGSIPATMVFKGKQRSFYERTFHDQQELRDIVKPFLNL